MIRAVFFDLDDTLIDDRAAVGAAAAAVGKALGLEPPPLAALLRACTVGYRAEFGYGTAGYAELAHLETEAVTRRAMRAALAHLGVAASGDALARLWVETAAAARAAYPETVPTLKALRAAGRKTGIITNGPSRAQREKLAALALADLLD